VTRLLDGFDLGLGVFAERWLFFIEAEQAVVLSKREW
jgi:hypothetical protein